VIKLHLQDACAKLVEQLRNIFWETSSNGREMDKREQYERTRKLNIKQKNRGDYSK
jgi:hypothetical protein